MGGVSRSSPSPQSTSIQPGRADGDAATATGKPETERRGGAADPLARDPVKLPTKVALDCPPTDPTCSLQPPQKARGVRTPTLGPTLCTKEPEDELGLRPQDVAPYATLGVVQNGTLRAKIKVGEATVEVVGEFKNGRLQGTKLASDDYGREEGSGSSLKYHGPVQPLPFNIDAWVAVCRGGTNAYLADPKKEPRAFLAPGVPLPPLRDGMRLPEVVAALTKWANQPGAKSGAVQIEDLSLRGLEFSGKPVPVAGAKLTVTGEGDAKVKVADGNVTVTLPEVDATLTQGGNEVHLKGTTLATTTATRPGTAPTRISARGQLSGTLRPQRPGFDARVALDGHFDGSFELGGRGRGVTLKGTLRSEKAAVSVHDISVAGTRVGGGPIDLKGEVTVSYDGGKVTASADGGVTGDISLPYVPNLSVRGDGAVRVEIPGGTIAGQPRDLWSVSKLSVAKSGVWVTTELPSGTPVALPGGAGSVLVQRGGEVRAAALKRWGNTSFGARLTCRDADYVGFGIRFSCTAATTFALEGKLDVSHHP